MSKPDAAAILAFEEVLHVLSSTAVGDVKVVNFAEIISRHYAPLVEAAERMCGNIRAADIANRRDALRSALEQIKGKP